jgi:hypothetical protein
MSLNPIHIALLAGELVKLPVGNLIGRKIDTPDWRDAHGNSYPGGIATIVEVAPDENAPEIVFTVEHPTWREDGDGRIGIFENEEVILKS